jgi:alkylresorcinol/alkylpyrone synthase
MGNLGFMPASLERRPDAAVRPVLDRWPRRAALAGFGVALPPSRSQQELWDGYFAAHYGHRELAERVWRNSGVERRHGVIDPLELDVSGWGTERRMRRFVQEALPLGVRAVNDALRDAAVAPSAVGQLTVVSCTGYATPGLDILIAGELGLDASVQRLHIGHMGCYAAIPGLASVADAAVARGRVSVLLCLELTSLHVQPATRDVQQLVAHALFADAAVASVVVPGPGQFEFVDVVARTDVSQASRMTWDVTDLGFRMGLSPRVPAVLASHVGGVVDELLGRHHLQVADVGAWAVHPGGPRILEVVQERVGLDEDAVRESRAVLRDNGNCSSATVMLILERIARERPPAPGRPVVAMAFGPGLTLYAALLRARD